MAMILKKSIELLYRRYCVVYIFCILLMDVKFCSENVVLNQQLDYLQFAIYLSITTTVDYSVHVHGFIIILIDAY